MHTPVSQYWVALQAVRVPHLHTPPVHESLRVVLQATQVPPSEPQAFHALIRHTPLASQHPVGQVEGLHTMHAPLAQPLGQFESMKP